MLLLSLPPVIFALRALPGPRCANRPDGLVGVVPLPDLGLSLLVGESLVAQAGRGLYVQLERGADRAVVSSGACLCGYCTGILVDQATGDKAGAQPRADPARMRCTPSPQRAVRVQCHFRSRTRSSWSCGRGSSGRSRRLSMSPAPTPSTATA